MIETATILTSCATIAVSCTVAYVAWQQWQVAKSKLRLDLFDRRYKVYNAARDFVFEVADSGKCSRTRYLKFCGETADAEFLFGQKIVDYLMQMRRQASGLRIIQEPFPLPLSQEEAARYAETENEHLHWFSDQRHDVTEAFSPYLSFSRVW